MEIRIFLAGHKKTMDFYSAALSENSDTLNEHDIVYNPAHWVILRAINKAYNAINTGKKVEEIREKLLNALTKGKKAERLIILDPRVTGQKNRPLSKELFFTDTFSMIKKYQALFSGHSLRFFVETRNPAEYIPASYIEHVNGGNSTTFTEFLADLSLDQMNWSNYIHNIQKDEPPIPCTIWRNEDFSYIWRDIIGAATGIRDFQNLIAPKKTVETTLSLQGATLFAKYQQKHPTDSAEVLDKIRTIFQNQFPDNEANSIDSYWAKDELQSFTDIYSDDWYSIERMDDVETIQPRTYSSKAAKAS